jgi:proline iminopeptidase
LAVPASYALWLRPRLLTWGATRDETTGAYPGDELIPDPDGGATMATTLPAPPEQVWPWLTQMGLGRGGWYGWDWLDNNGEPSADHIVPQWQRLEEGQRLDSMGGGRNWMTVAALKPNRTLVLRSNYRLPSGRTFAMGSGPLPRAYQDAIWGFHLRPAPGDRTRLVARTRNRGRPRPVTWLFDLLVGEPLHFSMQTRQFHNLRVRVSAQG